MGLFDSIFGDDPYERERRRRDQERAYARELGGSIISGLGPGIARRTSEAQQRFDMLPGIVERGFGRARKGVSQAFHGRGVAAVDQGKSSLADVRQGLSSAGFSSASSIMQNAQIGIGQQTSRALSALESQMAQIMADLDVREVGAMSAAQSRLGNFAMDRLRAEQLPALLQLELLSGVGPGAGIRSQPQDFGGLGVLGDQFEGLFSG